MSKLDTLVRKVSGNAGEENLDAKSLNDLLLKLRAIPLFSEEDLKSEIDPTELCDVSCAIMEALCIHLPLGGNELGGNDKSKIDFNPLSVIGALNSILDTLKIEYTVSAEEI